MHATWHNLSPGDVTRRRSQAQGGQMDTEVGSRRGSPGRRVSAGGFTVGVLQTMRPALPRGVPITVNSSWSIRRGYGRSAPTPHERNPTLRGPDAAGVRCSRAPPALCWCAPLRCTGVRRSQCCGLLAARLASVHSLTNTGHRSFGSGHAMLRTQRAPSPGCTPPP